ncbi:hypothetical protein MLD38_024891 [Melastoma candidum]|uniref:Uncharacterized protein n=1 Tax=Melastoma candidum TaxID=119954 RepID=A0ACB9NUM3_9MYRT|nr:hypothetical protein MLD38_024891 [Melastoma candidum]
MKSCGKIKGPNCKVKGFYRYILLTDASFCGRRSSGRVLDPTLLTLSDHHRRFVGFMKKSFKGSELQDVGWCFVRSSAAVQNGALAEKKVADATAKLEHVRRSESEALAEIKI